MDDLKVWIASMSKHDLDASKPLLECLRDGSALCQLINALRPHTVKKINKGSMHTKQVENLSHFLEGAAALGVTELFDAKRAHDLQDEALVVACLESLRAREAAAAAADADAAAATAAAAPAPKAAPPPKAAAIVVGATAKFSALRFSGAALEYTTRATFSRPPGRASGDGAAPLGSAAGASARAPALRAQYGGTVAFAGFRPARGAFAPVDVGAARGVATERAANGVVFSRPAPAIAVGAAGAPRRRRPRARPKVDWKKVKKAVAKDTRLATEAEVWAATRCLPGAVPPFGSAFPTPMPTHVDASLAGQINFNCGLRTRSVSMPFASFADLERPTVGDFTS
ncbi:hypothetical protein JL720_3663 [Aureococcus anophagefferens]|nr:hypothetical protein JL720_3663 [Aureococcus anophagefferens]